ncbi:unnamed protein product [Soboliphyme baturini]|uniref:Secreted protein n=1 Tax=Soboliphyme baturini TaxID=241478 RepID=A0A183I9V9_9BILA|nr:unnamed protein product [Soboliphyme baturini]
MSLLDCWFKIALNVCPNSCSYFYVATVNTDGTPAAGWWPSVSSGPERSPVPFASACFYLQSLKCQIIVDGSLRTVSKEETARIFHKHTFNCEVTAAALELQSSVS